MPQHFTLPFARSPQLYRLDALTALHAVSAATVTPKVVVVVALGPPDPSSAVSVIVATPSLTSPVVIVRVCPLTLTVTTVVSDELAVSVTGLPFGSLTGTATVVVSSSLTSMSTEGTVMTGDALT